jgi:hypothetical protein
MLCNRDISVRIRIRGSVPLTYGSGFGPGSCFFRQWLTRCQKNKIFRKIKVFLTIFALWWKDRDSDPEAHRYTDSTDQNPDPDLQRWYDECDKNNLRSKFIVLTLLTGSRTNEWNILNIYHFSLSPSSPFAANGWGWTPLKDSKKPILCRVIGPRLVRICQLSVSAGQLAELCVQHSGYLHAGLVWKLLNIVLGFRWRLYSQNS